MVNDLNYLVPLYRIAGREAVRLGVKMNIPREIAWRVYQLSKKVLEEYLPNSDPRDIVRACYYIVLRREKLLTRERLNILVNPSISWKNLVPVIEGFIS